MMTERLVAVEPPKEETVLKVPAVFAGDELPILEPPADPSTLSAADQEVMRGLVRRAREEGTEPDRAAGPVEVPHQDGD